MNQTRIQGNIKQIGNYILESELGEGQFGKVYKAKHQETGVYYAVKRIDKKKINSNPLLPGLLSTEIKIMQEITHPNILHLFELIESSTHYYLILNFCNQGDLECYMKQRHLNYFTEEEAVGLFRQIMNGFHELRKKKILHRDFKLANIFMSDDVLVIGDFGLAKMGNEVASTILGTPLTMAPELLQVSESSGGYTSKADIWSIGVVYYQLLFGDYPYTGYDRQGLFNSMKVRTGENLKFPKSVSEDSKDVLKKMLTMDPNKRINWSELFNHSIFNKTNEVKPSVLEGLGKLLQTFHQGVVTKEMKNPNEQFQQNKKQVDNVNNVEFFNLEQVQKVDMKAKHYEEKSIDPILERRIIDEMAMKEIEYTYNHERNKLLFLVFAVKHFQWELTKPECFMYADPLFQISMLILKKSSVLNEGLIYNLQKKSNIFKINPEFWAIFVNQGFIVGVVENFNTLSGQLKEYLEIIIQRVEANGFSSRKYERLIAMVNPNLGEVDKAIGEEKTRVQLTLNTDQRIKIDPNHNNRMTCLIRLIDVCIFSEQNLTYFSKEFGSRRKFKMEEFYKGITDKVDRPFY